MSAVCFVSVDSMPHLITSEQTQRYSNREAERNGNLCAQKTKIKQRGGEQEIKGGDEIILAEESFSKEVRRKGVDGRRQWK